MNEKSRLRRRFASLQRLDDSLGKEIELSLRLPDVIQRKAGLHLRNDELPVFGARYGALDLLDERLPFFWNALRRICGDGVGEHVPDAPSAVHDRVFDVAPHAFLLAPPL